MTFCFGKQSGNHIYDPKSTVDSFLTGVGMSSDFAIRFCPCPIPIRGFCPLFPDIYSFSDHSSPLFPLLLFQLLSLNNC